MKNQVVALITARGGSKGLTRKNVLPLAGKPMIAWTIEAARNCSHISDVFVSTEDVEIKKISLEWGAKIIDRPAELASDTASSESVIAHAIGRFQEHGLDSNDIVLLQPTSPLRNKQHLDEALSEYFSSNADCVISVFEPAHTPVKSYLLQVDGTIEGLYSPNAPYTRRQDLPKAFQPNGAIYAFKQDEFLKHNCIPRSNVRPYVMSEKESADVDTIEDLRYIETLIQGKQNDEPSF